MTALSDWLNPWAANRRLLAQLADLDHEAVLIDIALRQSNERYDRIRAANAQLREALALYRTLDTPPAIAEHGCLLSMTGEIVMIDCDSRDDAEAVFEWLSGVMGAEEDK